MDKFDVYEQWLDATRDTQAALERFEAVLGAWYCAGEAYDPADVDAALRDLREAGLKRWAADNEAGGGVDVLTVVAQGGKVCSRCNGTGRGVFVFSTFQFEICETCGGLGAILPDPEQEELDPRGDNASTLASSPCRHRLQEALADVYDVEVGE